MRLWAHLDEMYLQSEEREHSGSMGGTISLSSSCRQLMVLPHTVIVQVQVSYLNSRWVPLGRISLAYLKKG